MSAGPRRVLFLSSCVRGGGAGWSLYYLLKHLDRRRVEPLVVVPTPGIFGDKLAALGVEVVCLPRLPERTSAHRFRARHRLARAGSTALNLLDAARCIGPLRRLVRERGIEAIHCNQMGVKVVGALAAQASGIPCVLHVRNLHEALPKRLLYGTLARLPAVRLVIANSAASAGPYRRPAGRKVVVVPNGVDLDEYREAALPRGTLRRELGAGPDTVLVGFTGQLIPRKGIDPLVRAAARLLPGRPHLLFVAAGEVPVGSPADFLARYRALAGELGIADRFRFVGFRPDVRPLVVDFDLLVLPSFQEPFGRSLIEAMALGRPVVATRVGGVPEVVTDGEDGILVAPGDVDQLAAAIGALVDDPIRRAAMGRAARRAVERRFDVAVLTRRMEDLLEEVAAGGGPPGAEGPGGG